ncbi:MAG TPA: hypothetical protein VD713_00945, partial [Sphingomonadales bacterium]|nr:hypothetical protein [Sphingomonadales bacterium]
MKFRLPTLSVDVLGWRVYPPEKRGEVFMKKGEKAEKKGSLGPLVPALLAGGALIGAAFLGSAAEANAPGGRATTYQSLNGAAGFLAAGTKTGTQAVRSAQT